MKQWPGLKKHLRELDDKVLLCHCSLKQRCHGDLLVQLWDEVFLTKSAGESEDESGASAGELFQAAKARELVSDPEAESEEESGQEPVGAGWLGWCEPLSVGSGPLQRPIHDGAGRCSPGRWHPRQRRLPDSTVLDEIRWRKSKTRTKLLPGWRVEG